MTLWQWTGEGRKLFGMNVSSEAKGAVCYGCNIRLPPANAGFDFYKACYDTPDYTFCFWTKASCRKSISITLFDAGYNTDGLSVRCGAGITIEPGEKLFKYFRINREGGIYWCTDCFVKNRNAVARGVILELEGQGKVITVDGSAMIKYHY
ncbi:hypothetical protein DPMN_042330 [Dreissena polymorpha]|uniref:Uncharacterized protein n=1 Tax=Dreissena polymorpha TaxID=45954 RepID=A0A9D4HWV2_DREPO|nr:hypothetical protein DPMN_042330 [Dreissena polymorpha]